MKIMLVNWFDEDLHSFYNHDNDGFVFGAYLLDENEDDCLDVQWFKTEADRDDCLQSIEGYCDYDVILK